MKINLIKNTVDFVIILCYNQNNTICSIERLESRDIYYGTGVSRIEEKRKTGSLGTLPELLSPAGSPEALDAALLAGADAVYFGTGMFNARMNARNFEGQSLIDAINKAHAVGVRVHITMNTVITDRQMKQALGIVERLYKLGADALIVADLGLAVQIRRFFPDLELHASTQCSAHSLDGVRFLSDIGFSRVVLARELSKENIEYIAKNSPVPVEIFIHGAMCVSASGQCLMSSFIGGRSGNRGECAQPCRMKYNGSYPLSLKDMCLASHITEIIGSGAASLKIEGRMKPPEYVYNVTSTYRRLLDLGQNASPRDISRLEAVFSRSGFSDGYFTGRLMNMNGVRSESDKAAAREFRTVMKPCKRVLPEVVLPDRKHSLPENPDLPDAGVSPRFKPCRSARWYDPAAICGQDFFDINYIPLEAFGKFGANGVLLPPVIPDSELEGVKEKLKNAVKKGALHALISNVGQISLAKEFGLAPHGDFRLNICSSASAKVFEGLEDIILSPELMLAQIRDIKAKKCVIVYGKLPLMTLEKRVGAPALTDRTGATFRIIREGGRDILLNSVPIYTADIKSKMKSAGTFSEHFVFTTENRKQALEIINAYKNALPAKGAVRRIK